MSKNKRKNPDEIAGSIVLGVIVGFFILIFSFIKDIIKEISTAIKKSKQKEKDRLREEKRLRNSSNYIKKEQDNNPLDNLNSLILQIEEIYDEALLNNIDLDDEYMKAYNIKDELENGSLDNASKDYIETLEEELSVIIDSMNQKLNQIKEDKEAGLKVASVLLAEEYLFKDDDQDL